MLKIKQSIILLATSFVVTNANAYLSKNHFPIPKYIKLDGKGNKLSKRATKWNCVLDANNKLVWEIKTKIGPRSADINYKWGGKTLDELSYDSVSVKGFSGKKTWGKVGIFFDDWNVLVDSANSEKLCGLTKWRVPTIIELASLSSYYYTGRGDKASYWISGENSLTEKVYINTDYFSDIEDIFLPYFWSSTAGGGYYLGAWQIFYGSGDAYISPNRDASAGVRLVHKY